MKKLFLFMCLLCFVCNKSFAQFEEKSEVYYPNLTLSMSYCPVNEEADGIAMDFTFGNLDLQYQYITGETNKSITKNKGWRAGIGYNYRHWLTNRLYVEGIAGVQYSHATIEVYGEKESDGNLGLWASPKVGVLLFNIGGKTEPMWIGLQAGYRWDVNEFKFKKGYTADYFTIGFVIAG